MAEFWTKKNYSPDDIESTRNLLEVLKPMEEEKIKSNEYGFATIHIYALENNLDLELFLASGLNLNELSRKDKMTALQLAVAQGHKDMAKLLIAYGADIYMCEENTLAPLFIAIQKEDLEMVKVLLECGADPERKCKCSGTEASAMAFALVSQKMEIFKFLREITKTSGSPQEVSGNAADDAVNTAQKSSSGITQRLRNLWNRFF